MTDHAAIQQQLDRWEAAARSEQARYLDAHGVAEFVNAEYAYPFQDPARVLALVAGLRAIVALADEWESDCFYPFARPLAAAVASVFAGEENSHE